MNLNIPKSALFVALLVLLGACSSEESADSTRPESPPVQENLPPSSVSDQVEESEDVRAAEPGSDAGQVEVEPGASEVGSESASSVEPPTSVVGGQLPEGPGKEEFEQICSECHAVATAIGMRRSPEDWRRVIIEMLGMGADATEYQATLIYNYLTQNFGL